MSGGGGNDGLFDLIEAQPILQDRFCSLKRLDHQGSFSLVLTATDTATGDTVVVKFLHPFEREQYRRDSFSRESDILQRLDGTEGIIRLISPLSEFVGVLPPYKIEIPLSYYVVEFAERDVEHLIELGTLGTEAKLLMFKDMCKSVQRIHSMGLVHRDLKPGNFLLLKTGNLKLSDFGTARFIDQDSKPILTDYAGFPPGDVRYMSPEMLASLHDTDAAFAFKGDMFSLGAILFELFTGTILVNQLFDAQFQDELLRHMAAIARERRREIYDQIIGHMDDSRPLPSITSFAPSGPSCVLPIVNDLYRNLSALDYRKRTGNFKYAFLKINQALLVLRNEQKLRKWRENREIYRERLLLRRERLKVQWSTAHSGEGK
jgi:serine/threonine protein kinase